jgi:glycosyltransferase involved in cell wall biosynthesis
MKIGFDVSDLCTNRADGTTRYTAELYNYLPTITPDDSWLMFAPCNKEDTRYFPSPNLSNGGAGQNKKTNTAWHAAPWPKYWTQSRLPFELYKYMPDVLFMPIQQIPYLIPGKIKTVAVIHDLAVHKFPTQFTYKDWLLLQTFSAYTARYADQIIAVSKATAKDIAKYYGRTDGVHVIHHGVDHKQFRPPFDNERTKSWELLKNTYSELSAPFILYVGQIQPRKNIERLINAFEIIHQHNTDLQLVIAGAHGWLQKPILKRIKESKKSQSIHALGRVSNEILLALYWNAELFVMPSLYEGFGMPILEAMAAGCPVVTSNVSAMPEVAGDGAIYVDPFEVESMAQGMMQAFSKKSDLIQKGLIRAKQFNWHTTALKTAKVIAAGAH